MISNPRKFRESISFQRKTRLSNECEIPRNCVFCSVDFTEFDEIVHGKGGDVTDVDRNIGRRLVSGKELARATSLLCAPRPQKSIT